MIDGISIMVCVYIVFRIIERIIVVAGDENASTGAKVSLLLVGLVAGILSINLALSTHEIAQQVDAKTARIEQEQVKAQELAQEQQQEALQAQQKAQEEADAALEELRQLGQY